MLHANTSFSDGLYSSASVLGLYMDCFSASPHSQAGKYSPVYWLEPDSRAASSSSTSTWIILIFVIYPLKHYECVYSRKISSWINRTNFASTGLVTACLAIAVDQMLLLQLLLTHLPMSLIINMSILRLRIFRITATYQQRLASNHFHSSFSSCHFFFLILYFNLRCSTSALALAMRNSHPPHPRRSWTSGGGGGSCHLQQAAQPEVEEEQLLKQKENYMSH
eukprot:g25790.t1